MIERCKTSQRRGDGAIVGAESLLIDSERESKRSFRFVVLAVIVQTSAYLYQRARHFMIDKSQLLLEDLFTGLHRGAAIAQVAAVDHQRAGAYTHARGAQIFWPGSLIVDLERARVVLDCLDAAALRFFDRGEIHKRVCHLAALGAERRSCTKRLLRQGKRIRPFPLL